MHGETVKFSHIYFKIGFWLGVVFAVYLPDIHGVTVCIYMLEHTLHLLLGAAQY